MKELMTLALLCACLVPALSEAGEGRPIFHFTAKHGWINDPTGLIEQHGVYHLFFQYYNGGWALSDGQFKDPTVWGPMHWGHATSKDLIHWRDMPVALSPDKRVERIGVEGMAFSGSAVVDKDNTSGFGSKRNPPMVAMYTLADTFGRGSGQRQAIAYSLDGGTTWTKYAGNPVIPYDQSETFRDPQVFWFGGASKWAMVLSCGAKACFYNSPDLIHWTWVGEFAKDQPGIGAPWECPDLFPLQVTRNGKKEIKWVLVASVQHGAPSGSFGTQYFVGDFDGEHFTDSAKSAEPKWLDFGDDNYAARTWQTATPNLQQRTMISWMANWTYAKQLPAVTHRGSMTIPRFVGLHEDANGYYLTQRPVPQALAALSKKQLAVTLNDGHPAERVDASAPALIDADFAAIHGNGTLQLAVFEKGVDHLTIAYNAKTSELSVDRHGFAAYAFPSDPAAKPLHVVPVAGHVKSRILLDVNSAEVFVNDGRYVFTDLLYPQTTANAQSH